jgi:formamidopyrimidine-DNA glycosylase
MKGDFHMPELPEVECVARGLQGSLTGFKVTRIDFFRKDLRDPIPKNGIEEVLLNQSIESVGRRGKYILVRTEKGAHIIHLGMSGNLFISKSKTVQAKHTHVIYTLRDKPRGKIFLHYVDPRRFGRLGFYPLPKRASGTQGNFTTEVETHPWLANLGPEPLAIRASNLGKQLFAKSRSRSLGIKPFIMDHRVVTGVGNIYAAESLFRAKIHPVAKARDIDQIGYVELARAIQSVLRSAIKAGGTTIRDFRQFDGQPGYFSVNLHVYSRLNQPCVSCGSLVAQTLQAGRASYYCPTCQKL